MANQENINDLRKLKRRHLIYYLEVHDGSTGELLGHLVDLTVQGMKLVSKDEIKPDQEFSLKMTMPEELCPEREVCFKARSMWSKQDVNPDFYASGFNAPDLPQETRRLFMVLINQVGFND